MYAKFFGCLTLALVFVQFVGCADPNTRDRWARDYRVTPAPAVNAVPPSEGLQQKPVRSDGKVSDDARGTYFEVGRSTVSPRSVAPGGSLVLSVQYSVQTTNGGAPVRLTEAHALIVDNEPVELRRQELVRTKGTHTATAKVTLPGTLSTGNYTLVTTISDGKISKTAKTTFAVK